MEYGLVISPRAEKDLDRIVKNVRVRILDALEELRTNPRPPRSKKLKGRDLWRIRVGDYRAIYSIADEALIVTVVRVGHRKEVYREF